MSADLTTEVDEFEEGMFDDAPEEESQVGSSSATAGKDATTTKELDALTLEDIFLSPSHEGRNLKGADDTVDDDDDDEESDAEFESFLDDLQDATGRGSMSL